MDTARPEWLPADADVERPSIARMYDFLLGGSRHMEIDREVARAAIAAAPGIKVLIWQNRKFLKRVARLAGEHGVDQFLDLGSGIPARGNLHSAVAAENPNAKVVYVDIDPVAVARGEELLAGNPNAAAIRGDITDPAQVLAEPRVGDLLDLTRPVAVLMLNVLHFLPFDSVEPALSVFRAAMAPGSLLAISHGSAEMETAGARAGITDVYARAFGHMAVRGYAEMAALFGDFTVVDPGIVDLSVWLGEPGGISSQLGPVGCYAAVAVK